MSLAARVGAEAAIYDGVAPTLHQAHTADLRIGPFAVLIVRASKCRVIEGCIRDVEERAIKGHQSLALVERSGGLRRTERMTAGLHDPTQQPFPKHGALIAQGPGSCYPEVLVWVQHLQLMGEFVPDTGLGEARPQGHHEQKPDDTDRHKVAHASRFLLHLWTLLQQGVQRFRWVDLGQDSNTDLLADLVIKGQVA